MIKQIHNPADILVNGKHNFYQIVLELENGAVGFWSGNGFDYIIDGFFKGKALTPSELTKDYYQAVSTAETFARATNESGVIAIAGLPTFVN